MDVTSLNEAIGMYPLWHKLDDSYDRDLTIRIIMRGPKWTADTVNRLETLSMLTIIVEVCINTIDNTSINI